MRRHNTSKLKQMCLSPHLNTFVSVAKRVRLVCIHMLNVFMYPVTVIPRGLLEYDNNKKLHSSNHLEIILKSTGLCYTCALHPISAVYIF